MRRILPILCLAAFLLSQGQLFSATTPETIPSVHFTVIRLDLLTYRIKGYYEFAQSYRKSLLEEGFVQSGNVFYAKQPACDFGYTLVKSRLTGQLLIHAGTINMGTGVIRYPPDSLLQTEYVQGCTHPDPDTLFFVSLFGANQQRADSAWMNVKNTDIIHRLAAIEAYEIFMFDHFYSLSGPTTAEWIIIGYTTPPAPDDVGFVSLAWPRTLITRNVATIPEIVVHNFAAAASDFHAQITLNTSSGPFYESIRSVVGLPADSSHLISFDPFTTTETGFDILNRPLSQAGWFSLD